MNEFLGIHLGCEFDRDHDHDCENAWNLLNRQNQIEESV